MRRSYSTPLIAFVLPASLWAAGCVDPAKADPEEMIVEGTTGEDPGATSMEPGDDPAEDSSTGADDPNDSGSFIGDLPMPIYDCNVWTQDCAPGEKCMPWANDGGNVWNALRCVDIVDNPAQPGDPCQVEGTGVSGLDTCDIGNMCWDVDGETNTGTCVPMCTGDQTNPLCEDPDTSCVIVNDGVLTLCLPNCDPLLQDCSDTQACYPVNGTFTCAPDASGPDLGLYGDPCEAINACDAGLFCAAAGAVPGCSGSQGCCSNFCDLEASQPLDDCQGASEGQECLPWFEDGEAPPGSEAYGACALPST